MVSKKIIIGFLTFLILLSGVVYITFNDNVRIKIDEDKTTFYVPHENYSWIWSVSGREYNKIFDGSSSMNRQTKNITIETILNETGISKIIRTTPYIRGPIVIDIYTFNSSIKEVELFPISHTVEIINGSGFFYRYEVRDLVYDGETDYQVTSPQTFGRNMKVEFQDGYNWAHVYKSGILKVQYKIKSDYERFNVRLFDPITWGNTATGATASLIDGMTWNHDITCGDNMVLIVGISVDSEPTALVDYITYNGTSLSKIASNTTPTDDEEQAEMWNLTNPDCGASEPIVVVFTNPTKEESAGISAVYYGVDYINLNSLNASMSDTSTSSSLSVASSSADNWVVNVFALDVDAGSGISVSGDNATQRGYKDQGDTTIAIADGYDSDGEVTMGWSGFSDEWVQIGFELIPTPFVKWNQTSLDLGSSINNITSTVEISSVRANTNVKVDCSGNCTEITTNWTQRTMSNGQTDQVLITCSNATEGIFNATFNVTSDEDSNSNLFTVDCEIFSYGWLNISISNPLDNSNWVTGNENLTINATVTCSGGSNAKCGTVYALARYNLSGSPDTEINTTTSASPFYVVGGVEGWNLSTATYDNVNISSILTLVIEIFFKPDGTKLYQVSANPGKIFQFTCSDPWNLSSCTYDNVNISLMDINSYSIFFKPDGTKMYEMGTYEDLIYQYTCSDPWNISSCSYDNVNISTQSATPQDIFFKSDGTKLYEMADFSLLYQSTCSDAWNLSSCIYDGVTFTGEEIGDSYGIFFKPDGTKLYELGYNSDKIFQYTCSDPWNISSCSYNNVNITPLDTDPRGLFFKPDGTKMYESGTNSDLIFQSSLEGGDIAQNPQSSPSVLNKGQSWNVSWTLNVTTASTESYLLDVLFNSSYGSTNVPDNNTADRTVNLNPSEEEGDPDINWSSNIGLLRFLNCSPDWEFYPTYPTGQTSTISALNATNNGTATGSFQIRYFTTLNTGWELFSCRIASESDPKNDATNCITLSSSFQTIWSNVAAGQNKSIWLYGNCSNVSANPGVSIDMQAV